MTLNFFCGGCGLTKSAQEFELGNDYGDFCSEPCFDLHLKRRGHKRKVDKACDGCKNIFQTARANHRFCSRKCRVSALSKENNAKAKERYAELYPNGVKIKICRWCNEPMQVSAKKSYAGRLYHPDCSEEAQAARYRIKTVKRQKKTNPYRISPEQVVREYGSNCDICTEPIDLELPRTNRLGLTVDHYIPVNKGGTDEMSNLRPAHWICNVKKSDKMPEPKHA